MTPDPPTGSCASDAGQLFVTDDNAADQPAVVIIVEGTPPETQVDQGDEQ